MKIHRDQRISSFQGWKSSLGITPWGKISTANSNIFWNPVLAKQDLMIKIVKQFC